MLSFGKFYSLNIWDSVAEDTDRQSQYPGHYTALTGNNVNCTESSKRKKGASTTLEIAEWKHMGRGDGEKKRVEKREMEILVWKQAEMKKLIFT